MGFKKNQEVVRVIFVMGSKTASLAVVESVRKGVVKLFHDDCLRYDASTGVEIDPAIPGCTSELIAMEQ